MSFELLAAAFALLVGLWLILPLLVGRAPAAPRAAHDLQVFRDQLRSLDRDVERGVLTEAESEGARAEISRRLIAAGAELESADAAGPAPRRLSLTLALGLAALSVGGTAGVYALIGAPGLRDMPLAAREAEIRATATPRPSQAEAEAFAAARRAAAEAVSPAPDAAAEGAAAEAPAVEPPSTEAPAADTEAAAAGADDPERLEEMADRLAGVLAERPEDVEGRRLLAGLLLRLERPREAREVQQRVVDILADAAPADDHAALGEAMILAAGGYVSPEAEAQISLALQREPSHKIARYYAGLALAQNGQPGMALNLWRALLAEGPEDAPWTAAIRARLPQVERAAAAPVPLPGPSTEDMEAASELSAADRAEMIEGMVGRLEARLADEGGGPEEWARLLRAYGVLRRPEDATRIWADARRAFADAPDALAFLREAAAAAGADLDAHPNAAAPPPAPAAPGE